MRKSKKIITAFFAMAILSFPFVNSNRDVFATETGQQTMGKYTIDSELPSSVDLSQDEYFPPIGDQSFNGNCGYWSGYFTSFTYAYNKKHGIKTTIETCHNPIFGFAFYGRSLESDVDIAMQIGYPTMGALPLDHYGTNCFSPTKEVWEDAIKHRTAGWDNYKKFGEEDSIITGPDDPSLKQLKMLLANDLIVGIGTLSGKWNFNVVGDGKFKGESIIDRCDIDGLGGHGISFVGYDDEIWVDINHDGQKQKAEYGAFKMVNSWGADWGNNGFVWVSYDALSTVSQAISSADETRINNAIAAGTIKANKVNSKTRMSFIWFDTVSTLKLREKDTSNCLCYMTVNTGSRSTMQMSVTATSKKDGSTATYNFPSLIYDDDNYAWDGTEKCTDATMVFDLDNLLPNISPNAMEDYTWEVTFGDKALDEYALVVKDVYFGVDGKKKYVTSVSDIPLNGNSRTYKMSLKNMEFKRDPVVEAEDASNVIIYYNNSSYKDANIHYRVGSGTWTTAPGIKMCVEDEQSGYAWKYVVNIGNSSSLTLCFNNGNGAWDNNNKSDYTINGAGCYGIKDGKIMKLQKIEDDEEAIIGLDKSAVSLYVGGKTTVSAEVWPIPPTGHRIAWSSSDASVATVEAGVITGVKPGKAIITATLVDGVTATVEVTVSIDNTLQGLCKATDGNWYYYKNGNVDTTYTGMAKNKYGWWYIKAGKLDRTFTGMATNANGTWYMRKGKLDTTVNGMIKTNLGWVYITKGKLDTTYTGMAKNEYGWWYMKAGKLDRTFSGMATNANGTWYMKKGKLDTTVNGMIKTNLGWVYLTSGKLDTTYTGMAKNKNGWWYIKAGKLDTTFTGMATNASGTWYMNKGKLDTTVNGMIKTNLGWVYLTKGKLDTTYTGMAKNANGWWHMTKGTLDLKYTGVSTNKYGWWYVKNGKLDLTYNGKVKYKDVTYNVVNGKVVK